MSFLRPLDGHVRATAVVDALVVATDPEAPVANPTYWKRGLPWTSAVVEGITAMPDATLRSLGASLIAEPTDPARYRRLRAALAERDAGPLERLFELAWRAECNSRMGFHLGELHERTGTSISVDELRAMATEATEKHAEVLVIVPFQNRGADEARLRNLLACLLALRDQSFPRERYQVTVVESDETPRWRSVVAPHADHYLFAPKPGTFNKSWAVNAGAVNSPGAAELLCLLDADILVDRDYIARNVARFQRPGTSAHLTYRNALSLDPVATAIAIRERLHQRKAEPRMDRLRGFIQRRTRGGSIWLRTETFHRIGGLDERYEGWGGEDNDFFFRLDLAAPLDSYDDTLLHMHHPPGFVPREDGKKVNARIPWLSWHPEEPIGRLERFVVTSSSTSEAGSLA